MLESDIQGFATPIGEHRGAFAHNAVKNEAGDIVAVTGHGIWSYLSAMAIAGHLNVDVGYGHKVTQLKESEKYRVKKEGKTRLSVIHGLTTRGGDGLTHKKKFIRLFDQGKKDDFSR